MKNFDDYIASIDFEKTDEKILAEYDSKNKDGDLNLKMFNCLMILELLHQ